MTDGHRSLGAEEVLANLITYDIVKVRFELYRLAPTTPYASFHRAQHKGLIGTLPSCHFSILRSSWFGHPILADRHRYHEGQTDHSNQRLPQRK